MDYIEVRFHFDESEEYLSDLLAADLAEIGFETFASEGNTFLGFCPMNLFNEEKLQKVIDTFVFKPYLQYTSNLIKAQNWNENWEKNYFEPIILGTECVICSTFHKNVPEAKYKILIDPKMSFGTGHHETTALMLRQLLKMNLQGKSFLDMGCGTAVLAILAAMKGASPIIGIDINEWAYNNSLENIRLNNVPDIQILLGGAELLKDMQHEVIFANINRNILLADMQAYAACLLSGGELYISGFYVEDISVLNEEAQKWGLQYQSFDENNNWATVRFVKK
jgi:ribosomal protein L11 methyltransferase